MAGGGSSRSEDREGEQVCEEERPEKKTASRVKRVAFMAGGGSSRSEDRKGEQVCDEERTVFFVF